MIPFLVCFHSSGVKQSDRTRIDSETGTLTIQRLTMADEQTLTCIFRDTQEHIASLHIKIKGTLLNISQLYIRHKEPDL